MKSLFWNTDEKRLRTPFRILLQALLTALIVALPLLALTHGMDYLFKQGLIPIEQAVFHKLKNMTAGVSLTLLVIVSLWLGYRFIDHRAFKELGLVINGAWWKQWILGFLLSAALISLVFLIEYGTGLVEVIDFFYVKEAGMPALLAFIYPVVKAVCVGTYEEAISRGYLLTNLKEGFQGWYKITKPMAVWLAVFLSSVVFGFLHWTNPNATVLSTAILVGAGVLLATAYVTTRRLALPIGIHMGWNLFQGWIFGFPVSGDTESATFIQVSNSGPDWLTGGAFGPEGGLIGLLVIVLGILVLARSKTSLSEMPASGVSAKGSSNGAERLV